MHTAVISEGHPHYDVLVDHVMGQLKVPEEYAMRVVNMVLDKLEALR